MEMTVLNQDESRVADHQTVAEMDEVYAFPLSFAQQRLWFLDQLEPNRSLYNVPAAIRLRGRLNVAALQQTLDEVVRRHEILRTTFALMDDQPVQVISPAQPVSLPLMDLSLETEDEREARAQRMALEEANRPFDLAIGPLVRTTLLRLSAEDHLLLITTHHIICDGWSIGVLVKEVSIFYRNFLRDEPAPVPELPIQYADYAQWQQNWLLGDALQQQLEYWRRQLAGTLPVLKLPLDNPRPATQSFRGGREFFVLDQELSAQLRSLSRNEGVSLFMLLLAGFKTLLYRCTEQEDILVGTPIAGRTHVETEALIGAFINTLVLRTRLDGELSFRELLRRVREVTLSAYAHQEVPFEKLVEDLAPERDPARTPFFQVAFGLQNAPPADLELPGLIISSLNVEREVARFDLTVWMMDEADGLHVLWTYNTDLFVEETIKRMQGNFETLLRSIVVQPDAQLDALVLLTKAEKEEQAMKNRTREGLKYQKLMSIKPKTVRAM